MKVFKFLLSLSITLALIYALDTSWVVGFNRLPPMGKFLDPFHGFWKNMDAEDQVIEGDLDLPGLKANVTIVFDSLEIPHIFASTDADLYFAQGYITAKHRLWQMEIQTHAAAGRLSEILGESLLDNDRYMRRLGMTYGAANITKAILNDSISKMITERYTAGINAYIASLDERDLPFEYKLLDYKPEPWTIEKCALVLMNMTNKLAMSDKDMEMTNALKLYGKDLVNLLYPDQELTEDPIVDKPGEWKFNSIKLDTIPMAVPEEFIQVKKKPGPNPYNGSNNWAVAGNKTATGAPILCGDPHLALSLPSLWYSIHLHAPGVNVMGASLPGVPEVIIGFNDSIAWSITNAQRDLVDWYTIMYQNKTRDNYLLDGKWTKTKKVIEAFTLRDGEVFYDTIIYTHWGPVTYDKNFHAEHNVSGYAFRWLAHDASDEFVSFYKLNRAKNHEDFSNALDYFSKPPQNFVFAGVDGDIAIRVQGKFPVRRSQEGKFVLDGSKSSQGWHAFIPPDQHITDKNPARGFVSSANQYPVDNTYPYYINGSVYETYRNRRINQVLRSTDSITVADMMTLQNDNFNLKAFESLPYLLQQLDSLNLSKEALHVFNMLKTWDYNNSKESEGAAYFDAWFSKLTSLVWDEMRNKKFDLAYPSDFTTIKLLKEQPALAFFDIQSTPEEESAGDVIRKSFTYAIKDIEDWKTKHTTNLSWAAYKDSYIPNLLRLKPLGMPIHAAGNPDNVNAMGKSHGPSWRMVVSLEKTGVKAWAVYPGGQSGNPGSKHYNDMVSAWTNGQYISLQFTRKPEDVKSVSALNLTAARK